jgi:broad specificity phosphatase PhoE
MSTRQPMSTRLTLICHGATAATRLAAFPSDEGLEPRAHARAERLRPFPRRRGPVLTSPARRAHETAAALGLDATPDEALRDLDLGRWSGRRLEAVEAEEPAALAAWLTDPEAAPHGGETILALAARAAAWLDRIGESEGTITAITHPAVIRVAILHTLGAPMGGFWRIDVAPLSFTEIHGRAGRWTLHAPTARAVRPASGPSKFPRQP